MRTDSFRPSRRQLRRIRRVDICQRHERGHLFALFDEPNGTNPPKHIGYVCAACAGVFTANATPSAPLVPSTARIPNAPLRPSRAHVARLRAVDRLGVAFLSRRAIAITKEAAAA